MYIVSSYDMVEDSQEATAVVLLENCELHLPSLNRGQMLVLRNLA